MSTLALGPQNVTARWEQQHKFAARGPRICGPSILPNRMRVNIRVGSRKSEAEEIGCTSGSKTLATLNGFPTIPCSLVMTNVAYFIDSIIVLRPAPPWSHIQNNSLSMSATRSSTEHENYPSLEKPSSSESNLRQSVDRVLEYQDTTNVDPSSKQEHDPVLSRTKSIAEALSPIREFLFIGLLCCAQLVTQAGLLNSLNILHIIGSDLGITNPGVLSWLVAGYSLTVGTFILLSGRCGDLFGYKIMMIIGFAWFAIWNIIAGFSVYASRNGGQVLFIFSRVLGGIGPAILLPNALGLLGATYNPGRKKDMIFSLFGACAPGGAVVGGTFAGLWSLLWWPWTFWTFGITLAILAILSSFILPSVPLSREARSLSYKEKLVELDLLGASVGITAMILFNFAINQAPGFGWSKVYIYLLLIFGTLLFLVFFWIELKVAEKPLLPFDALSVDVSFVLFCEACGWAAFGTSTYLLKASL
jgi:MFS family permease